MSKILDALKGYMTPELMAVASEKLGETTNGINKATEGLLPIILGGLAEETQDKFTFNNIFDLLKDPRNTSFLNDLGGLIGGGNLAHNDPKDLSGRLMSMIFGSKVGDILDSVSSYAGIDKKSVSSLLGMVGPLIMGYMSKLIKKENLNVGGLVSLLNQQKDSIISAIPGLLAGQLGFTATQPEVRETVAAKAATGGSSSMMKWLLPLILLAGLGYLVYNMDSCSGAAEKASSMTDNMMDAAEGAVEGAVEDAGDMASDMAENVSMATDNATKSLGAFFSKKMDCGTELNIPQNGIEHQVIAFVEDETKMVDKTTWFNFDRLVFETGKADLNMAQSEEQLKNIAAIMKCYPKLKLKIGGYTDNSGADDMNMKLSQNRADKVKIELVKLGVSSTRLDAEGYGEQHPVASNETEEGKAQNRRIAARVMEK